MGKRGAGEGSFSRRKNGLWQAAIMYTDPITGIKQEAEFLRRPLTPPYVRIRIRRFVKRYEFPNIGP